MKKYIIIILSVVSLLGLGFMTFASDKANLPINSLKISAGKCNVEIPLYSYNTILDEGGDWVNPKDAMFHLGTIGAPPLNDVSTRTIHQFFLLDKEKGLSLKERGKKLINSQGYKIIENQSNKGVELFIAELEEGFFSRFYMKDMTNSIIVMSSTTPGDLTNEMVQMDSKIFSGLKASGC